jgi:hypothetical protein
MRPTGSLASLGLEQTRRRVARWREARPDTGAPMPAALWTAAVALARHHGLYTTARTLRVDYGALKKRLVAAEAGRVPPPAFVELPAARPSGLGPCDPARWTDRTYARGLRC